MADTDNAEESGESTSSPATSLSDLFSHDDEPEERASSSAHDEKDDEDEKEKPSQSFREVESSPEKDDTKPKAEKKELPQNQPAKAESKDASKEGEKPSEQAAEADASKKWENEENPYFKRFKDTANSWQREHQEKLQLQSAVSQMQQEMATLRKIADGTYDPEVDAPKPVSHETVAEKALNVGKVLASRNAAISQYGAEEVNVRLGEFSQLFDGNELINGLVLNSEAPVYEAFRILDRYKFEAKYGSDPVAWHKNIRAEAEKELRDKLKAEITEELMGRADKKNNTPRGLSSSRGSNGLKSGQNSKGKGPSPLSDIFSR